MPEANLETLFKQQNRFLAEYFQRLLERTTELAKDPKKDPKLFRSSISIDGEDVRGRNFEAILTELKDSNKILKIQEQNDKAFLAQEDKIVNELQEIRKQDKEAFAEERKRIRDDLSKRKLDIDDKLRERQMGFRRHLEDRKIDKEFYDLGFKKDRDKGFLQKMYDLQKSGKGMLSSLALASISTAYEKTIKSSVLGLGKVYTAFTGRMTEGGKGLQEANLAEKRENLQKQRENEDLSFKISKKNLDLEELRYQSEIHRYQNELKEINLEEKTYKRILDRTGLISNIIDDVGSGISKLNKSLRSFSTPKSQDNGLVNDRINIKNEQASIANLTSKSSSSDDEVRIEADERFRDRTIRINQDSSTHLSKIYNILHEVSDPTKINSAFTVRLLSSDTTKEAAKKEKPKPDESKSWLKDLISGGGLAKALGAMLPTLLAGAGLAAAAGTLYASVSAFKAREETKTNAMERDKHLRQGEKALSNIEEKRLGLKANTLQRGLGTFEGAEEASKGLNIEQLQSKRDLFQMSTTRTENRIKELERNKKLTYEKGVGGRITDTLFGTGFKPSDQKELENLQKEMMAKKASIGAVDKQILEETNKAKGIITPKDIEKKEKESITQTTMHSFEPAVPTLLQQLISIVKNFSGDYKNIVQTGITKAASTAKAYAAALPTGTVDNVVAAASGSYGPAMTTTKSQEK